MSNDLHAAGEPLRLPLSSISVQEGFNPRRAFRQAPLEELTDSIRRDGLIQAILVRPRTDGGEGYWIVAGERRYRACTAVGLADIPALVRHLDDREARLLALKENTTREDLSPAEEALSARDTLDSYGGDKQAAASHLGWSASKLESRLLLLTASPSVLQAVAEGAIGVGHAELLAGLPEEQQDKALARIIEGAVSIADLKEAVKGIVIPLTRAVFDTADCSACPFNTALQGSLFGDAVQGANCKQRACFAAKTNAALEAKRAALAEDVGTVAMATEKDASSYTALLANGPNSVGEAQFAQCRGCTHYGALIHNRLDGRTGQVDRPVCFNLSCHSTKVAAHAEAEAEALAAASAPDAGKRSTPATSSKPSAKASKAAAHAKGKAGKATAKTAAPAASSQAARAAMKPAYMAAASRLLAEDPRVSLAIGIASLERLAHDAGLNRTSISPTSNYEDAVAKLLDLESEQLALRYREACSMVLTGTLPNPQASRNNVYPAVVCARLSQAMGADLAHHFKIDETYLAAHTREGIAAVLAESGFDAWLKEQPDGEKRAKALTNAKKSDLIQQVMASGFDWTGFVPAAVKAVTPRSFVGV